MDVTEGTVNAAMNCVATLAIDELARAEGLSAQEAAQRFLASRTAERLFNEPLKMWGYGPSALVDDYLAESKHATFTG